MVYYLNIMTTPNESEHNLMFFHNFGASWHKSIQMKIETLKIAIQYF